VFAFSYGFEVELEASKASTSTMSRSSRSSQLPFGLNEMLLMDELAGKVYNSNS